MFLSRSQDELMLILDLQSSVVRGSLVHARENDIPIVLFTRSIGIPYKPKARSAYVVKLALKAVSQVIHEVLKELHVKSAAADMPSSIAKVHYVLSSPWIISQAKTISVSFDKNTMVNRSSVLKLIENERAKLSSNSLSDMRVIEEKVFDVLLNGYSVNSWNGRETKEMSVSFVVSVAGDKTIQRLIDVCDVVVRRSRIQFHSSLFLQHAAIQKIMPDRSSYALIHVHGELTDVAIVRERACVFFGSFPFGINTAVRSIAQGAMIENLTAESLLDVSSQNQFDAAHAKKENSLVQNMSHHWISELKKLISQNLSETILPSNAIISARLHEDFFAKSLKTAFSGVAVESLKIESILPFASFDAHTEQLRLTGLYAIAIV